MNFISADSVVERLKIFGITVNEGDMTPIELIINGTEEYILNYCNINEIPFELYNAAVDICCGTFLKTYLSTGRLDSFSSEGDIASLTEGDFTVSFKTGTGSTESFTDIIDNLIDKRSELECFKKLRW